jgi:hypothetical protein
MEGRRAVMQRQALQDPQRRVQVVQGLDVETGGEEGRGHDAARI